MKAEQIGEPLREALHASCPSAPPHSRAARNRNGGNRPARSDGRLQPAPGAPASGDMGLRSDGLSDLEIGHVTIECARQTVVPQRCD